MLPAVTFEGTKTDIGPGAPTIISDRTLSAPTLGTAPPTPSR